jgi:hypothetical protein
MAIAFRFLPLFLSISIMLSGTLSILVAQDACCTPDMTAKIATTGPSLDIVGIKLGMPAPAAVSMIKSILPKGTISVAGSADYERAYWADKPQDDPNPDYS